MSVRQYRKKPVVIEAIQWDGSTAGMFAISFWGTDEHQPTISIGNLEDGKSIEIETLEGVMRVSPGDYVIKGVQGEFYPCKPDIFEQTYEAVNDIEMNVLDLRDPDVERAFLASLKEQGI